MVLFIKYGHESSSKMRRAGLDLIHKERPLVSNLRADGGRKPAERGDLPKESRSAPSEIGFLEEVSAFLDKDGEQTIPVRFCMRNSDVARVAASLRDGFAPCMPAPLGYLMPLLRSWTMLRTLRHTPVASRP